MNNLSTEQLRKALHLREQIEALEQQLSAILGGVGEASSPVAVKGSKKRKMSAAGRRAIAAGQKARWAKLNGNSEKPAKKGRRKMSPAAKAKMAAVARARWAKVKAAGKSSL